MDLEQVGTAATQMVSSGFSPEEGSGGSLREQLRGLLATNVAGKEEVKIEDIIRASSSYLSAQGLDKNAENVREINARISTLYKTTNLQYSDFMEFARESVAMKGVVDRGTQLASIATLVDVMSAPEAATGLRNVVSRMRTVRGTPAKEEGLAMLGVKPEEIDLVGEDFLTALRKISEGMKRTKAEDIPIALKKIFEEKGVSIAQHLLNSIDLIATRVEAQAQGMEQYIKDYKFASEGVNAAAKRQENERFAFMAKSGKEVDELRFNELRQYMLEEGYSAFRTDIAMTEARTQYYLGRQGADAVRSVIPYNMEGGPDKVAQIIENRMNAKLQGIDLDPQKIKENILKPKATEPSGVALDFDPGQVAFWEQKRQEFRDPNHRFRNSKINPWYNRAKRYPAEDKAIREARGMSTEIGERMNLFGELSPEELKRYSERLNTLQKRGNAFERNVHAYDLQLELDRMYQAVGTFNGQAERDRVFGKNAPGAAPPPNQAPPAGPANAPANQAPPANRQNQAAGDNGVDKLVDALNRNTKATENNTRSTGGNSGDNEPPAYRPTTTGQQRGFQGAL